MIGLHALAAAYGVLTVDRDGYDVEPSQLRDALLVVMAARRDDLRAIIARLEDRPGSPCPPIFVGELQAAAFALRVVERDVRALLPRRVIETTGRAVESSRPFAGSLRRFG